MPLLNYTIGKRIREGEKIPKLYGFAFFDYITYKAICYPIPLNFLVSILRKFWTFCQHGLFSSKLESQIIHRCHQARAAGYIQGKNWQRSQFKEVVFDFPSIGERIVYYEKK